MKISRHIWAWQRNWFERRGWTLDGGIWPRLRITRPMTLDDYIYGDGPKPAVGLAAILPLFADCGSTMPIDRGPNPYWRNNFREEGEYGEGANMVVEHNSGR